MHREMHVCSDRTIFYFIFQFYSVGFLCACKNHYHYHYNYHYHRTSFTGCKFWASLKKRNLPDILLKSTASWWIALPSDFLFWNWPSQLIPTMMIWLKWLSSGKTTNCKRTAFTWRLSWLDCRTFDDPLYSWELTIIPIVSLIVAYSIGLPRLTLLMIHYILGNYNMWHRISWNSLSMVCIYGYGYQLKQFNCSKGKTLNGFTIRPPIVAFCSWETRMKASKMCSPKSITHFSILTHWLTTWKQEMLYLSWAGLLAHRG